jgi:hypothetical protein
VQRVPATEAQGRIHTSTATVAVLPEAEEVDLELKPDEIRVEVCRAGGPGGQGVNTTDSAVQVMHIPTGMIVRCQDGRSQQKNKDKAMQILRSRLLEKKQREEDEKYAAQRKSQVGTGERSEKIRTYNFPQNRITDHRIELTLYNLDSYLEGQIAPMIEAMQTADMADRLATASQGHGCDGREYHLRALAVNFNPGFVCPTRWSRSCEFWRNWGSAVRQNLARSIRRSWGFAILRKRSPAPTGRHNLAQGNALGFAQKNLKPCRGGTTSPRE